MKGEREPKRIRKRNLNILSIRKQKDFERDLRLDTRNKESIVESSRNNQLISEKRVIDMLENRSLVDQSNLLSLKERSISKLEGSSCLSGSQIGPVKNLVVDQ